MDSPDLTVHDVNQIKNMLNSVDSLHIKDCGDMISFTNVLLHPNVLDGR